MPLPLFTGPSIEDQLSKLDDDLRRLKVEFDIFFAGGAKRPPIEIRNRVEQTLRRLGDDRSLRYEHRFRIHGLSARYNVFRDLWRRMLQQREEGQLRTGYFKVRDTEQPVRTRSSIDLTPINVTFSDPAAETEKVRELFDVIISTKQLAGEETDKLSLTQFTRLISSRTEQVKQATNCQSVVYSVTIEDGKVRFSAKGKRD